MSARRSAGICDLKSRNHTVWGSTARLSYVCGAKSRDVGCSYARGTTRRRDMPDVVAPYVIGTILTVGNTGGANTDPRYAGGATRVRNRLLVKNSYASGVFSPHTASTTQQRTPLNKDKGEAAERKRKLQWRPSFRSPSGSACHADTSDCHPTTTDHNTPCPRLKMFAGVYLICRLSVPISE